jgi:hypothetical protein
MGHAIYKIVRGKDGWSIEHDGQIAGSYATKEVAFEAAVLPASNAIKRGHKVTITVEGASGGEAALGAS